MKFAAFILATITLSVTALGRSRSMSPDHIYGSGPEFEKKVMDDHIAKRNALGLGAVTEMNATMTVDHFNNTETRTFPMRYLIDKTYYNEKTGPILFYTGNEGGIVAFYNNSGFVAETLAKQLNACVVFAEHRYYGTSLPFYPDTFKSENLPYLSVKQVMMDYVTLVNQLKDDDPTLANKATILFGGSYGGMLSAWMRMKYPMHFQGALAASAPILWFGSEFNNNKWSFVASQVIREVGGQECYDAYHNGFFDLTNLKYDASKYAKLQEIFNTCEAPKSPEEVQNL